MTDIELVDVDKLLLDEENPRLPSDLLPRTQEKMIAYIASKEAIEDLMTSIGRNGFFHGEALVAYRNSKDKGRLRVIEGNRRLTAVKLLLTPSLYSKRPAIKELSDSARNKELLHQLPVVVFDTRAEVLPYLGSRHIVGVRQWEPLAKARYMQQLYEAVHTRGRSPKESYRAVAEQIGSYKRSDYIKSNLDGLAVYEVMEKNSFFDIDGLSEEDIAFGSLYTALGFDPIAAYVGAAKFIEGTQTYERFEPINTPGILKVDRVKRLAKWLYEKNDDGEKIVGESRDFPKLAKVLASPVATKELESGADLEIAYGYTSGINDDLLELLQAARKQLRKANGLAPGCTPTTSHNRAVDELAQQVEGLQDTLSRRATKVGRGR